MRAGERTACSAATAAGSGAAAPAGHASEIRTAPNPRDDASLAWAGTSMPAPVRSGVPAVVAAAVRAALRRGEPTRTSGSASTAARFPAQSRPTIRTGYEPGRDGSFQATSYQPPVTWRSRSAPAADCTATPAGLETQKRTCPTGAGAKRNAGGCVTYPAKRTAASAKRGSESASAWRRSTTNVWYLSGADAPPSWYVAQ